MSNFKPQELLPKEIYNEYGDLGMRYLDSRILPIIEYVRKVFEKPIIINNWADGGQFNERTVRLPEHVSYKKYSDHSFGRAIDFDIVGLNSLEVQHYLLKDIIASTELKKLGVTGIESQTIGWSHISVADFRAWSALPEINGIKLIPIK